MKTCKSCNKDKPLQDYYTNATCKGGYNTRCKTCCYQASRKHDIARKYGISVEDYDRIMEQAVECECCGATGGKLVYDHCHETGDFRGVLCYRCNTGIGKLGDNLDGLLQAVRYLTQEGNDYE